MKQQTFPRNQARSRKAHHFPFLDVGRRGGGSKVSIYFVQECVCNVQYTPRGDVGLFAAFEMWKPNVILSTFFGQLLDMLKFYTGFEINDVTGKNLVYKCASMYFTLPIFI